MLEKSKTQTNLYANVFWQFVLLGAKYLLPFILLPYLTRVLSKDAYAVYAYLLSLMVFIQIVIEFGFNLSIPKILAKKCDNRFLSSVNTAVYQIKLFLSSIICLIFIAFARYVELLDGYIVFCILLVCATALKALLPDFVFIGKNELQPITLRFVISRVFVVFPIFIFVKDDSDLVYIALFELIANIIALLSSVWLCSIKYEIRFFKTRAKLRRILFQYSIAYCFSNVAASVLASFTTVYIGSVLQNTQEVACWSVAISCISALQTLYNPIINSLYAHVIQNNDYKFVLRIALFALPALILCTTIIWIFSDTLVLFVAGEKYEDSVSVFQTLIPILAISFYSMLFGWPTLGAMGQVKQLTLTTVTSAIICIFLLFLMPLFTELFLSTICFIRIFSELVLCIPRLCLSLYRISHNKR